MVETTLKQAVEHVIVEYPRHVAVEMTEGQTIGQALDAYIEANDSPNYVVPKGKKTVVRLMIMSAIETDV